MNLISQNCLAGHIYKSCLHESYGNPFVWSVIDYKSMYNLITLWDCIHFDRFALKCDKNWNFSIIIDDIVKVQYVHYTFDPSHINLYDEHESSIKSNKIWEYIVASYITRTKRMLAKREEPVFCICNIATVYPDCIYTSEEKKQLSKFDNVKIMNGLDKVNSNVAAIKFYHDLLA